MSEKDTPKIIEETQVTAKRKKSNKDIIIETLTEQNKKLSEMVEAMLASQALINEQSKIASIASSAKENKKSILIGCRSSYPVTLGTADERISYSFKRGDIFEVDEKDLDDCFKNDKRGNRGLFAKGVLYFVDSSYYQYFRIGNFVNFSVDYLKEWLLNHSATEAIAEFSSITKDKKELIMTHTLIHSIGYALIEHPREFDGWKYDHRLALEKYFDVKFENIIAGIKMYENKTPLI